MKTQLKWILKEKECSHPAPKARQSYFTFKDIKIPSTFEIWGICYPHCQNQNRFQLFYIISQQENLIWSHRATCCSAVSDVRMFCISSFFLFSYSSSCSKNFTFSSWSFSWSSATKLEGDDSNELEKGKKYSEYNQSVVVKIRAKPQYLIWHM